jgi:hypothetical protein
MHPPDGDVNVAETPTMTDDELEGHQKPKMLDEAKRMAAVGAKADDRNSKISTLARLTTPSVVV